MMCLEVASSDSSEHGFACSSIPAFEPYFLSTRHAQSVRTGDTGGNQMAQLWSSGSLKAGGQKMFNMRP